MASQGELSLLLQPREGASECMHIPSKAGCPRLPCQTINVDMAHKSTPCMASCPTTCQCAPHTHAMQQERDLSPAPQTKPLSPNTNPNHGSLIGPSIIHAHADGPRPKPHTNAPKQPTSLGHSPHELQLTYPPKPTRWRI